MSNETYLSKDALIIAKLVMQTDTDQRGLLYRVVADKLINQGQNYTGSLFMKMADQYGFPVNCEPDMPNVEVRGGRLLARPS